MPPVRVCGLLSSRKARGLSVLCGIRIFESIRESSLEPLRERQCGFVSGFDSAIHSSRCFFVLRKLFHVIHSLTLAAISLGAIVDSKRKPRRYYHHLSHLANRRSRPFQKRAVYFGRESPSHPPGAKDHVSGILDSSAKRNSGEVVAENWNSVPHGRWSLPDRRACEMSVQRLINVVRHSQQASRVNAAMRGPSKEA